MKVINPSVILVFICTLDCISQDIMFKNYNEQNGLPSSEVYQVFQDHAGFIWFATDNGVVRFDGAEMKLFNKYNGLSDAVVFSFYEDSENNLWFKTFSGATSIYKNGKITPYPFNDHLKSLMKSTTQSHLVVDSLGQVYISGIHKGVFRITKKGVIEQVPLDSSSLNLIRIVKKDFIMNLVGLKGVYTDFFSYNGKKYRFFSQRSEERSGYFCKSWRGSIYFSVGHWLYQFDGAEIKLVLNAPARIINISVDREDNFWIGLLNHGAERFSDVTFHQPRRMPLLEGRSVTSVLQDNEGGFWFSTLDQGVHYVPNLDIYNYFLPHDSKVNFVLSTDESIFVGYYNGTLLNIDKNTKEKKWSLNLHLPIVAGVFIDEGKLLRIATSLHTVILNSEGAIVKEYPYGVNSNARKFFKGSDGFWGVGSLGAYEFSLKDSLLSFHKLDFWCRNILVDGDKIYLAGITGLRLTDRSFKQISDIKEFDNDKISNLLRLPDGKILVTTIGTGFKVMDGEKIISFDKKDGLVFENIYSAVVDSSLWMATEKGLLKVDLKLLTKKNKFSYQLLDKGTGLVGNKVNFVCRSGNDTWCIFSDGFSVFDDRVIHFAKTDPTPRLNNITVNNTPIDLSQPRDFSYFDNNIGFDFGFLAFNNRNIFIRHKSSHSSGPWNYAKDFTVNYYSLASGKYQFDFEYSIDNIHWRKIDFPNTINIKPVWWETIYFRLTILLVVGLFFFIYFRYRYKNQLVKLELQNKLKSEKERIAKDLHDNIGSKLVSISLSLNHIVKEYEIDPSKAESIYNNVDTTATELRDTIWAIQKEGVTIGEFCDKLSNLLWRLRQNGGATRYDLEVNVKDKKQVLKPSQVINLYRIVQESITNSQKHSRGDVVSVHVCENSNSRLLCITVKDNGNGFLLSNALANGHYGLKNMKSRADEINASLEITSQQEKGTTVIITLPLGKNNA